MKCMGSETINMASVYEYKTDIVAMYAAFGLVDFLRDFSILYSLYTGQKVKSYKRLFLVSPCSLNENSCRKYL